MTLSIIIPAYNEHGTLCGVIKNIRSVIFPVDYEIIIVDDGSTGAKYEECLPAGLTNKNERCKIKILRNAINRGKGFSVRKGIEAATGDIIIIQDADIELDPNDIPGLLEPILNNEADVVYGSRFLCKSWPDGMSRTGWLANKALTKLTNILYGLKLTDMETCYKVFRAEIVKNLDLRANQFTFEPEVTALIAKRGISIKELPVSYCGRTIREGKKIKAKDFISAVFVLLAKRFT